MIRTVEATIDENGFVNIAEPIKLQSVRRALVTILEEKPILSVNEEALLSERSLAEDWKKPEEEEAWSHLQPSQ